MYEHPDSKAPVARTLVVTVVVLLTAWWLVRDGADQGPGGDLGAAGEGGLESSATRDGPEGLETDVARHAVAVEKEAPARGEESDEVEDAADPESRLRFDGAHQRSDDLLRLFFGAPERVAPKHLIRHSLLNPEDRVIHDDTIARLEVIIDRFRPQFTRLVPNYRQARNREMISLVNSGAVKRPRLSAREDIEEYARRHFDGAGSDREDAGLALETYIRELESNPPLAPVVGGYMSVGKRRFAFSWFQDLPQTDPMYEEIASLAREYLVSVCEFFEVEGYARHDAISELLRRAGRWTPQNGRGIR